MANSRRENILGFDWDIQNSFVEMRIDVHYFPERIDVLVVADAFVRVAYDHSGNQVEADY